jgi:thiamine-phosphate pyrophosphorylase
MVDLRLYALVDPVTSGGFALDELARRVAGGGATLVQLRDKEGSTRRLVEEARAIKQALRASGVPLLINDRVDVALAAAADGVHIGQDDMAVDDARRLLGPRAIIGLSLKTVEHAKAAPLERLDYVAIGGVFTTTSKSNTAAPIGPDGLRTVVAAVRARDPKRPIAAIAGIDRTNAGDVIAAGADGIAVISALSTASDPAAAARALRAVVDQALARRGAALRLPSRSPSRAPTRAAAPASRPT